MSADNDILSHFLPTIIPADVTFLISTYLPSFCKYCVKFHPTNISLTYKGTSPSLAQKGDWYSHSPTARSLVPLLNRVFHRNVYGWKLRRDYNYNLNNNQNLASNCTLEYMTMHGQFSMNGLGAEGVGLLARAGQLRIPIIEASGCAWPTERPGLNYLVHKNLVVLKLNDCWITDKSGSQLVSGLRNTSIQVFILTCKTSFPPDRVADETATAFGKVLPSTSIKVLDLSGNKITLKGVKKILKGLGCVKVLDLSRNSLGISNEPVQRKNLEKLKKEFFGAKQKFDLKEMMTLVSKSGLISLDISKNRFGDDGMDTFLSAMGSLKFDSLKELFVRCNFDKRFLEDADVPDFTAISEMYEKTHEKISNAEWNVKVDIGSFEDEKTYYMYRHINSK